MKLFLSLILVPFALGFASPLGVTIYNTSGSGSVQNGCKEIYFTTSGSGAKVGNSSGFPLGTFIFSINAFQNGDTLSSVSYTGAIKIAEVR